MFDPKEQFSKHLDNLNSMYKDVTNNLTDAGYIKGATIKASTGIYKIKQINIQIHVGSSSFSPPSISISFICLKWLKVKRWGRSDVKISDFPSFPQIVPNPQKLKKSE